MFARVRLSSSLEGLIDGNGQGETHGGEVGRVQTPKTTAWIRHKNEENPNYFGFSFSLELTKVISHAQQ